MTLAWLFFVLLALYAGIVYAAPDVRRKTLAPAHQPRPPAVYTPLISALVIVLLIDGLIFHTGWYNRFATLASATGRVALCADSEMSRPRSAPNEVLVIGDSRVFEGFSAPLANELTAGKGYRFTNLAIPGSSPRVWYYLLRQIDPLGTRYRAIVMPLQSDQPALARLPSDGDERAIGSIAVAIQAENELIMAAPLLRYTDAIGFAGSFRTWNQRYKAFTLCVLRGAAYRSDLGDFLGHPTERIMQARRDRDDLRAEYPHSSHDENLVGIAIDPVSGRATFPSQLLPGVRRDVADSVRALERDGRSTNPPGYWTAEQPERWTQRILARYKGASNPVVMFRLPRGPLAIAGPGATRPIPDAALKATGALVLDQRLLADLERPQFFFDGHHPNENGRREMTRRIVQALLELNS